MDRREFLKGMGLGVAVVAMPFDTTATPQSHATKDIPEDLVVDKVYAELAGGYVADHDYYWLRVSVTMDDDREWHDLFRFSNVPQLEEMAENVNDVLKNHGTSYRVTPKAVEQAFRERGVIS